MPHQDGLDFDAVLNDRLAYRSVDDMDARLSGVAKAATIVLRSPWSISGIGRIAILRRPAAA